MRETRGTEPPACPVGRSSLERSILQTINYFDVLALPLTSVQIWRSLIWSPRGQGVDHGQYSLREVTTALKDSPVLLQALDSKWGYYYLKGRETLVRQRLERFAVAQDKWRILTRIACFLALVPCVRMLAGSGSLAFDSPTATSDLDLLVVADYRRLWLVRLFLLLSAQSFGRRRKYWDRQAPDKVCLNHYLTDKSLAISADIRNVCMAEAYTHLVPLCGLSVFADFQAINAGWLRRFLRYPSAPLLPSVHGVQSYGASRKITNWLEVWLLEPMGDYLEWAAEKIQRRAIARHTIQGRPGRIVLSAGELAFHPDTKVPKLLEQFFVRVA